MKDRKYSLIRPFWLEMVIDDFMFRWEMDFGNRYSSQIVSISVEASFWLAARFIVGTKRWIMVGKYPRRFENLDRFDACLNLRSSEVVLSSRASVKPSSVTVRAVSFRWYGIVSCGIIVGGMLRVIRYPAKMLPSSKRLMGLISSGLFSFTEIIELNRGCPRSVENIIRVL